MCVPCTRCKPCSSISLLVWPLRPEQFLTCTLSPWHVSPPHLGAGLVHSRVLHVQDDRTPEGSSQGNHSDQSLKPPSTVKRRKSFYLNPKFSRHILSGVLIISVLGLRHTKTLIQTWLRHLVTDNPYILFEMFIPCPMAASSKTYRTDGIAQEKTCFATCFQISCQTAYVYKIKAVQAPSSWCMIIQNWLSRSNLSTSGKPFVLKRQVIWNSLH